MNRRTWTCLLAAGALASCGQPPSPAPQRAEPPAEVTTTTTTSATSATTDSVVPAPIATAPLPKPPPKPHQTTTTTTKPPPPPPKPPDRWVLPAALRGSIEQRSGQQFPGMWALLKGQLAEVCPGQTLCVGYALVVDSSTEFTDDCYIIPGGISIPDPLHEGGKITFRVTNDLCAEG